MYYDYLKKLDNKIIDPIAKTFMDAISAYEKKALKRKENAWYDLQAKIEETSELQKTWRYHFCSVCGYCATSRSNLMQHALAGKYKASHPDFEKKDAILLEDVQVFDHRRIP